MLSAQHTRMTYLCSNLSFSHLKVSSNNNYLFDIAHKDIKKHT